MTMTTIPAPAKILRWAVFGPASRFRIDEMCDRFGVLVYFVADAEEIDDVGLPLIIRQASSIGAAVAGLDEAGSLHWRKRRERRM